MDANGFVRVEGEDGQAPSHLSYSRISRYLLCPEQYRLYYIEGLRPETPPASLAFGQAIHQALAAFFQERKNAIQTFLDLWEEQRDQKLRYAFRESWEGLNERGQGLLAKFLLEELPKLSNVEASERPFTLDITNLDAPFVGVIDLVARLEGVETVIDFKTAATGYQDHEVHLSDQLAAYQLAAPRAQQLALCVFVKTKEPRIEWYTTRRNGLQLNEFLAKAELVGSQIGGGIFYKRPGKHCAWCDYLGVCMNGST